MLGSTKNSESQDLLIPRILIAAPSSGSGKTVITCGLLEILRRRGVCTVSFKCGPDYIDPMFHKYVLGIPGYNLDSFFLSPSQVRDFFAEKTSRQQMAVIEGAMGYYDGLAGISTRASAYEIACITETPVILVADGKKSSLSLAALVKGFLEYRPDSRIAGVIINRVSAAMEKKLRPCIEETGIRCLGFVPEHEAAHLESRHLGLALPDEQQRLREKIEKLADLLENTLDIEGICRLAEDAGAGAGADAGVDAGTSAGVDADAGTGTDIGAGAAVCGAYRPYRIPGDGQINSPHHAYEDKRIRVSAADAADGPSDKRGRRRIAVACDEAFCFYYQENVDFLNASGWETVPFSPIHDHLLPEGISALLLGGGYPECHAKELSDNMAMRKAVEKAYRLGTRILAECGGFLYLHQTLEGMDGKEYPMAGVIPAKAYRTDRLSRFGYVTLKGQESSRGDEWICGHEFHYWDSTAPGKDMRAEKPLTGRAWDCIYRTKTMIAGFPHLYYLSNPLFIARFLEGTGGDGEIT